MDSQHSGLRIYFSQGGNENSRSAQIDEDSALALQDALHDAAKKGWPEDLWIEIDLPEGGWMGFRASEFSGVAFRFNRPRPTYKSWRKITLDLAGGASIEAVSSDADFDAFIERCRETSADSGALLQLQAGAHEIFVVAAELISCKSLEGRQNPGHHKQRSHGRRPQGRRRRAPTNGDRYDSRPDPLW